MSNFDVLRMNEVDRPRWIFTRHFNWTNPPILIKSVLTSASTAWSPCRRALIDGLLLRSCEPYRRNLLCAIFEIFPYSFPVKNEIIQFWKDYLEGWGLERRIEFYNNDGDSINVQILAGIVEYIFFNIF